jgi:hypothetical protein
MSTANRRSARKTTAAKKATKSSKSSQSRSRKVGGVLALLWL